MSDQADPTLSGSVERALRLMEAVGAHEDGAPADRLALEAGLAPATAHALLRTLIEEGYLRRLDDGAFVVGDSLHRPPPGGDRQPNGRALVTRVRPLLVSLRDELSAASYLTFYEDGEIRIAEVVDGPLAPRADLWVGFEEAGHATALGKCVLRELDPEARGEYLSRHPLPDLTPRTITEREELIRQLEAESGAPVVMDREEYALGTVCVAVPVYSGDRVGSLGISFRSDRMYRTDQVRRRVLAAASRVTRGLSL